MIRFALILALLLIAGPGVFAEDAFGQAQQAYDQGRYDEAAARYESMLTDGIDNLEVHYNLANACFKAGDLPRAVWHYRTAWHKAPRDPDLRANLHFAQNAAGAIEPAPPFLERSLTSLSAREWIWTALGSYLLLALLLTLALVFRRIRPALLKLGLLPLIMLLVSAAGWWQWNTFRAHPEAVVIKGGTTALYGPVEGGTAYYKLPVGALVRQRNIDPKGWVEVAYDGKSGWIRQENILHVSP